MSRVIVIVCLWVQHLEAFVKPQMVEWEQEKKVAKTNGINLIRIVKQLNVNRRLTDSFHLLFR